VVAVLERLEGEPTKTEQNRCVCKQFQCDFRLESMGVGVDQ